LSNPHEGDRGDRPLWHDSVPERRWSDGFKRELDILVIGGGIAGVSAAWHCTNAGLSSGLIEAEFLGARASGRNDGQVLLGLGEHLNRLVEQWGQEDALELWSFLDENQSAMRQVIEEDALACDFESGGGLRFSASKHEQHELEQSARLMEKHGIQHELLDKRMLQERVPLAEGFFGALELPGEAVFDPCAFVRGLAMRARKRGLEVREGVRVVSIDGSMGEFRVALSDGSELQTRTVLHATSALGSAIERSGFLAREIFPFRGQVLATEPLPAELATQMPRAAMSSNFCYEYWRMHETRLTLGGLRWSVRGEELGLTDDTRVHPQIRQGLREWLRTHFPALSGLQIERDWSGIMAGTRDGLPLIGEIPGRAGELASVAFNGYGMSFAFLAGRCIAEILVDGRPSHAATRLFAPRRLRGESSAISGG
jgi:gamma-glutamylputrescine oxidase